MKIWLFLVYLTAFIAYPYAANAVEELKYKHGDEISASLELEIGDFLSKNYETNVSFYSIASTDLNGDGLDEHILKKNKCNLETNQCTYLIIAETNGNIVLLSKIRARTIIVGGTSSHGINDLLSFKNGVNDYNFDIYIWSPSQKTYILKTQ